MSAIIIWKIIVIIFIFSFAFTRFIKAVVILSGCLKLLAVSISLSLRSILGLVWPTLIQDHVIWRFLLERRNWLHHDRNRSILTVLRWRILLSWIKNKSIYVARYSITREILLYIKLRWSSIRRRISCLLIQTLIWILVWKTRLFWIRIHSNWIVSRSISHINLLRRLLELIE